MDKGEFKIPRVGSAVLIEHNGKFLLGKRNKQTAQNYWVIPGGKVEWGENLEQAAIREIKEETNLDVDIVKFICWKEIIEPKNKEIEYHRYVFFFLGKLKNDKFEIKPTDDVSELKFFTIDEIKKIDKLIFSAKEIFQFLKLW